MATLFYKYEGKFTKQEMGPSPKCKKWKPFFVSWISECEATYR